MNIKFENVFFRYPGENIDVLDNINLEIKGGTITAIMGESGSGKSTLLRLFNALRAPTSGRVLVDGEDINAPLYDRRKLRERIGLVFQSPESQLFEESVIKDVSFGPRNKKMGEKEALTASVEALNALSIEEEKWNKSPFLLSGGEKRRVSLAGILALKGEAIVLDEISSGLDKKSKDDIFNILISLKNEGKTVIFTTHESQESLEYSDRVILLEKGRVMVDGRVEELYQYDRSYMTDSFFLLEKLKEDGIPLGGNMTTLTQSLNALSLLLHRELRQDE